MILNTGKQLKTPDKDIDMRSSPTDNNTMIQLADGRLGITTIEMVMKQAGTIHKRGHDHKTAPQRLVTINAVSVSVRRVCLFLTRPNKIFLLIKQSYPKPRERNDSNSTDQEDHRQTRTRFPMNASSGQVSLFHTCVCAVIWEFVYYQ